MSNRNGTKPPTVRKSRTRTTLKSRPGQRVLIKHQRYVFSTHSALLALTVLSDVLFVSRLKVTTATCPRNRTLASGIPPTRRTASRTARAASPPRTPKTTRSRRRRRRKGVAVTRPRTSTKSIAARAGTTALRPDLIRPNVAGIATTAADGVDDVPPPASTRLRAARESTTATATANADIPVQIRTGAGARTPETAVGIDAT